MYHFLNGYTARVAGTERGLGSEPQATFSACFGEPFLPRDPLVYAKMLGEKLRTNNSSVWLINTGWTAGKYGVGHRMSLAYTRAIVHAAIEGGLAHVPVKPHPVFRVLVPESCPGVAKEILDPRAAWADKEAYDRTARDLATRFQKNFEQKFSSVGPEILAAGPITV
jgi:phosphoenolpyruvate carboxykinase (ATP)